VREPAPFQADPQAEQECGCRPTLAEKNVLPTSRPRAHAFDRLVGRRGPL